jgi:hypothetical protein
VIQRGNAAQEQAIARQDATPMQDILVDEHYRAMAQINRDMLNNGVVAIKLDAVAWGPITVNGTQAQATTDETWTTTFASGTTQQAIDRNVYRLVQQQGIWRIAENDHPGAGGQPSALAESGSRVPPPSGSSGTATVPAEILPPNTRGVSENWSGYTTTRGRFTSVRGAWDVPHIDAGKGLPATGATWVGIGGVRTDDLIQAGTEETVLGPSHVAYSAWIELLPRNSEQVPLVVHPGDHVVVAIEQEQPGSWRIAFANQTTSKTYERRVQYTSSLMSAEWIVEAPSGRRGRVLPLDAFGTISFTEATAVRDGRTVNLAEAGARPVTMINGARQPLAIPSAVGEDGASFGVKRSTASPSESGGRSRTSP